MTTHASSSCQRALEHAGSEAAFLIAALEVAFGRQAAFQILHPLVTCQPPLLSAYDQPCNWLGFRLSRLSAAFVARLSGL